jgi:hypothetical protein
MNVRLSLSDYSPRTYWLPSIRTENIAKYSVPRKSQSTLIPHHESHLSLLSLSRMTLAQSTQLFRRLLLSFPAHQRSSPFEHPSSGENIVQGSFSFATYGI